MSIIDQIEIEDLLGESFCQNSLETLDNVGPNAISVDSSVNAPSPGLPNTPLLLLNSASEGEEWTDDEVMAISESSGKCSVSFRGRRLVAEDSVSFRGRRLVAEDWGVLWTLLGNVVATWTLFVPLTEELWTAVELFKSSVLPEARTEENML